MGPNPARIGDTVTYNLRVTVPAETVLPGSYLSDTIARDGLDVRERQRHHVDR